MKRVLVTGMAGFVGYHLAKTLLARGGFKVTGLDNFSDYYDPALKRARLKDLGTPKNLRFFRCDLKDSKKLAKIFKDGKFDYVLHMGAQAGVRCSLTKPSAYIDSNLAGFANILEGCRHNGVKHLVFASSSSVYGANRKMPFSTDQNVDHPLSLYAATKKSNELMAHAYAHLFRLPVTGLRFFTVYGPWGRPDMSYFLFTEAILKGKPIPVFNHGKMLRDFTYIDDIVGGVLAAMERIAVPDPAWNAEAPAPASSDAPYRIYNIGNNKPVELLRMIQAIEAATGKRAQLKLLPMQSGDVLATFADISELERDTGFRPATDIEDGLRAFVAWHSAYRAKPRQRSLRRSTSSGS